MQMIEAIFKPQKLDDVKAALAGIGILGATASEVKGYGKQGGHTERYRGSKMEVGFVPKIRLCVCVKDSDLKLTIDTIVATARTGAVGDGKIFVSPVTHVIRIRTGEVDDVAL
jgi:nitrogen regulatory protein PII